MLLADLLRRRHHAAHGGEPGGLERTEGGRPDLEQRQTGQHFFLRQRGHQQSPFALGLAGGRRHEPHPVGALQAQLITDQLLQRFVALRGRMRNQPQDQLLAAQAGHAVGRRQTLGQFEPRRGVRRTVHGQRGQNIHAHQSDGRARLAQPDGLDARHAKVQPHEIGPTRLGFSFYPQFKCHTERRSMCSCRSGETGSAKSGMILSHAHWIAHVKTPSPRNYSCHAEIPITSPPSPSLPAPGGAE